MKGFKFEVFNRLVSVSLLYSILVFLFSLGGGISMNDMPNNFLSKGRNVLMAAGDTAFDEKYHGEYYTDSVTDVKSFRFPRKAKQSVSGKNDLFHRRA